MIFIPQIELGINYFINDNVALEFVIPVSYTLYTESSFSSIPPFNFRRLDILPSVGFQVFINKSQITNDEH